jgi:hypothetical protein
VKVPDYISPLVAYRIWRWDASGLRSLNGLQWLPGKPLGAECRAQGCHEAPQTDCACGVYAAKSLDHLRSAGYMEFGIHGEVWLWGTVVEHEAGWRAQFAYPKQLALPLSLVPVGMIRIESWLTTLAAYGCDIVLHHSNGENVSLWHSDSGYDAAGLDLLLQRSNAWYERRRQERRIEVGDRVAIAGRGTGVVDHVDGDHVYALMGNRGMVKINRNDVCWDETNKRWESAIVAGIKSGV